MGALSWVPLTVGAALACFVLWFIDFLMVRCEKRAQLHAAIEKDIELAVDMASSDEESDLHESKNDTGFQSDFQPLSVNSNQRPEVSDERARASRLLVFALAIQHVPEALAVGVAFAVSHMALHAPMPPTAHYLCLPSM